MVRLYLDRGRVEAATTAAVAYIDAVLGNGLADEFRLYVTLKDKQPIEKPALSHSGSVPMWLSGVLVDRLHAALIASNEMELDNQLQKKLAEYHAVVTRRGQEIGV